jgi:NAD+ kinase
MKKVVLTPNPYRDSGFQTVRDAEKVLNEVGVECRICLPFEVDRGFALPRDMRFSRLDREIQGADAVICFGGDGTILHMAKFATRHGVPILGVNIGTMGFIAELEAGELHQLKRLANNDFAVDSRMMLDVTVARDRDIIFHDICLNDVVITKNSVARIVNLNVSCDGIQAMDMAGDGVIVATPTGSTAYSLSAGGPIMEPETRSVLVTPICAHDMASRSMVVSDKRTVQITLTKNARRNAFLSVDGGRSIKLNMGDVATVKRSSMETKLIRLKDRSFYEIVNQKFRSY